VTRTVAWSRLGIALWITNGGRIVQQCPGAGGIEVRPGAVPSLQEIDHPEARIAHRGICASPDAIFGSHRLFCSLYVQ
jgi:hypothetical protein